MMWQLAVLAPLLLATLFQQLVQIPQFAEPLQEIAEEITDEVLQVNSLQLTLYMSAIPVKDYLIHGNQREIDDYRLYRRRVDRSFSKVRAAPFGEEREYQLVESAWKKWGQAKVLARKLLAIGKFTGNQELNSNLEQFDKCIEQASADLEVLYSLAYREIEQAKAQTQKTYVQSTWVSTSAFIFAVALSLCIGATLTRSILLSLESLRSGASMVATGQFDRRVYGGTIHELRVLADAFNTMAGKLQAHEASLRDMAENDALTGLGNRRSLDTRLDEEIQRTLRYQHPFSLLMIDIDHFKSVNDSYGHPAGDAVLRQFATILRETVRPMDRVFRYGGEEFVVVMPETTGVGAMVLARRIQITVEQKAFHSHSHTISITVSLGVAACPDHAKEKDQLISAADRSLYRAKQDGRNRACLFNASDNRDKNDVTTT